jgi:hypothetical protein
VSILPGTTFTRLRASISYAQTSEAFISQWYWKGSGEEWSEERSLAMPIKRDGKAHVYWTFIPSDRAPKGIQGLRFDPVNGLVDAKVHWIALDEVK